MKMCPDYRGPGPHPSRGNDTFVKPPGWGVRGGGHRRRQSDSSGGGGGTQQGQGTVQQLNTEMVNIKSLAKIVGGQSKDSGNIENL
jgi:hypothetical protein